MRIILLFILLVLASARRRFSVHNLSNPAEFALVHNLRHVASVAGYEIFEEKRGSPVRSIANLLREPGLAEEVRKRLFKRDPMDSQQWHLKTVNAPCANSASGAGGARGRGVRIAIVDDGVQHSHPDLSPNFDASLSYDFNGHKADPTPYSFDGHGTSAAGVCCAAHNNVCGQGVAPEASIVGLRLIARTVYDYEEAQALGHHNDKIRIYSNSWGPPDDGQDLSGPGRITREVFRQGYLGGRSLFVWAAGNGRQARDSSNYDGYANSPYTLSIAAVDHDDRPAYYSEPGACNLAAAPSSGASGYGIATTDLMGTYGYAYGDCTTTFGGTSAAAPLAAGVFALMIEKRPELTVRDVQHIVAKRARKVTSSVYSPRNARGYTHSDDVGFGVLNVPDLLAEVSTHKLVPQLRTFTGTCGQRSPFALSFIETVVVKLTTQHQQRGQVQVALFSPHNVRSQLAAERGDGHRGQSTWEYSSLKHWGEELKQGDVWRVEATGGGAEIRGCEITWMGY